MLKLILDQKGIEEALIEYISTSAMNVDLSEKEVNITIKTHRGDTGYSAEIELIDKVTPETVTSDGDTVESADDQAIDFDFEQEAD